MVGYTSSRLNSNQGYWMTFLTISKSNVITNYTTGADILIVVVFSLSSFMYFIPMREIENKLAEVLATIIGTTVKYMEYTRPKALANMLRFKKE